ncbi:hypothetical protein [Paenibacillus piri]|uniref:DUF2269 family protein n=1 Tax=Paenibacillus piri TaxID=2547395 RepID=A0A4R5KEQ2_9BACL|nr:hypothetical protein [Paenibacillus piri]TDF93733.1 hypothetical protein E1757_25360 [Paenibacillus piri]
MQPVRLGKELISLKLSKNQKKWLLTAHLAFAGIMLGETVVIVILSIAALFADNRDVLQACYTIFHLLARTGVRAATIGTAVTGILLSVLTHWGLFRYYWIIAKEGLTLLTIVIGPIGFYIWSLKGLSIVSAEGLGAMLLPEFKVNAIQLWIGLVLQAVSLVSMIAISVFKPWGQRSSTITPNS